MLFAEKRWHAAHEKAIQLANDDPQKRGKPRADDKNAAMVHDARKAAFEIKGAAYTLGKAPEHLTENQKIRLDMIQANDPQLFRAYRLKESLRLLLKSTDVDQAEEDLKHWLFWASHSRIPAFKELYKKIRRHIVHILNTIRLGLSNARIEATNNKIKLIIRKPYALRIRILFIHLTDESIRHIETHLRLICYLADGKVSANNLKFHLSSIAACCRIHPS